MIIINNNTSFHLWWKENLVEYHKVSEYYDHYCGLGPNHLKGLCLWYLTDKILKEFDEDLLTGMIRIDLHKAFDTINHEVLLQKLQTIKFSEQNI